MSSLTNVQTDEGDKDTLSSQVDSLTTGINLADSDTNDSDDVFRETHANGANDQKTSATNAIDELNTNDGRSSVDDIGNDGNREGVADTSRLEEGRSATRNSSELRKGATRQSDLLAGYDRIVGERRKWLVLVKARYSDEKDALAGRGERGQLSISTRRHGTDSQDEVDTGQLLPCLQEDTGPGPETIPVLRVPEAVDVRARAKSAFRLEGQSDLSAFSVHLKRVHRA